MGGSFAAFVNGGTSFLTNEPPEIIAWSPMWINWCTAANPPITANYQLLHVRRQGNAIYNNDILRYDSHGNMRRCHNQQLFPSVV
jgi:hypothetical protein